MDNLFASLLENLQQEVFETLFIHDGVEVERSSAQFVVRTTRNGIERLD